MIMGHYSFHVHATNEVAVPSLNLLLDPGTNAFSLILPPDSIEEFTAHLRSEGVRIIQVNRLDGEEAFHGAPLPIEALATGNPSEGHHLLSAGAEAHPHRDARR